jgi:hypothetical protein
MSAALFDPGTLVGACVAGRDDAVASGLADTAAVGDGDPSTTIDPDGGCGLVMNPASEMTTASAATTTNGARVRRIESNSHCRRSRVSIKRRAKTRRDVTGV